jgi:hypothetical protein
VHSCFTVLISGLVLFILFWLVRTNVVRSTLLVLPLFRVCLPGRCSCPPYCLLWVELLWCDDGDVGVHCCCLSCYVTFRRVACILLRNLAVRAPGRLVWTVGFVSCVNSRDVMVLLFCYAFVVGALVLPFYIPAACCLPALHSLPPAMPNLYYPVGLPVGWFCCTVPCLPPVPTTFLGVVVHVVDGIPF